MAEQMSDTDVKKMLELLKEQATDAQNDTPEVNSRKKRSPSDEDIKAMLKKHYSADAGESDFVKDDYSFEGLDEFISEEDEKEEPDEEIINELEGGAESEEISASLEQEI